MATKMQQRRGTSAQWAAVNPVLADGEMGYEKDTGVVKVGNGTSTWNQLSAILGSSYLPILGKAYDSDRLDGLDSTAYAKTTEVLSDSATRKLGYHWGSGQTFPTSGVLIGDTFLLDTGGGNCLMQYNGSNWRQSEPMIVASVTVRNTIVRGLHAGFAVIVTGDVEYHYNGSAWVVLFGGGFCRYRYAAGAATSSVNGSQPRVPFSVMESSHPDITPNATFDLFTLNRAGVWDISTSIRWATVYAATRTLVLINDETAAPVVLGETSSNNNDTLSGMGMNASTSYRFAAGAKVSIQIYTTSVTAQSVDTTATGAVRSNIALTFVRS